VSPSSSDTSVRAGLKTGPYSAVRSGRSEDRPLQRGAFGPVWRPTPTARCVRAGLKTDPYSAVRSGRSEDRPLQCCV